MPVIENDSNSDQYPTDRRSGSKKKTNDIESTPWPVVTQEVYQELFRGKSDAAMNLKMKRLCMARIRLWQAMNALDAASHDHNPQVEPQNSRSYNLLRGMWGRVSKDLLRFPLIVKNK